MRPATPPQTPWFGMLSAGIITLLAALFLICQAPASWLGAWIQEASAKQVQWLDATGTIWQGSAQAVWREKREGAPVWTLPGRLKWQVQPGWTHWTVRLEHTAQSTQALALEWRPWGQDRGWRLAPVGADTVRWPLQSLQGLGTPWNTVQLRGTLSLVSEGGLQWFAKDQGGGHWAGDLHLKLNDTGSRLSHLPWLGDYQMHLSATTGSALNLELNTLAGPLRLQGKGQWDEQGLRFQGMAQAEDGRENELSNLLNILGRREGRQSLIFIG